MEEQYPDAFIIKMKFTIDFHFHSKLPVRQVAGARCSVWSEELLSEFHLRVVGWDEGEDTGRGNGGKTPQQDAVRGRDPASGAHQIFPEPGLLKGHDHSEKARRNVIRTGGESGITKQKEGVIRNTPK